MRQDFDELARRMKAGEGQAFVDFADEAGPWLRRRFLARGLTAADAEALAVSAVSDIVMRLGKFQPRENGGFRLWVWTVALNASRDQARKRQPGLLDDANDVADTRRFDPAFEDDQDALVGAVREAIETLGEPDRTIVRSKLDDPDMTHDELGKLIGLKTGTVRVRHHRALSKLADLLKEQAAVREWCRRRDVLRQGPDVEETDR